VAGPLQGKPLFGTLIACLHAGVPVLGIIDQCILNERWLGVQGQGTRLNGELLSTRGCSELSEAMMYATTPHMFAAGVEEERYKHMCAAVKRPLYGADCYAYALVASGFGADLVVEADLGLYDYCALVPVVEGAGGIMTDWNGRRLTLQNHGASKGRVVAAANPKLHGQAVRILRDREHEPVEARSPIGSGLVSILGLAVGALVVSKKWV
jgi:inositol-phosphate phosphatase/L-galactose 1-phosphate phosphatase/histidinol-phosphatase